MDELSLPQPRPVFTVARAGLVGGPLVAAALALLPSPLHGIPGFGDRPAYAAAVAALMAVWWFTEALPIAWTACVPLLAYPILGVTGAVGAVTPYADAYIFLFLGGMAIGAAMEEWSLHRRVALSIMRAVGTEPRRLLLGMLVATASVSLWISNTATAVMMMPIGMALLAQLEKTRGQKLWHFGTAIMLGVAYGSNVGGIGTKIGTATNSIFAGYLSERLGYDIGFLRYMAIGLPFVVLFLPVVWLILWRVARRDELGETQGREIIEREIAALGPMGRGEKVAASVFGAAAALWILGDPLRAALPFHLAGKNYEAGVAMLAAAALILMRALPLSAIRRIPWSTLLLLGGSFAMAAGIEQSGLSVYLASKLALITRLPEWEQLAIASSSTVALTAIASNTATVSVMLNVLPGSLPVLAATNLAASCDSALPAGTPPNAIVFGSGYIRLPTMMRVGFLLDVLAALLITVYSLLWVRHVL